MAQSRVGRGRIFIPLTSVELQEFRNDTQGKTELSEVDWLGYTCLRAVDPDGNELLLSSDC